MRDAAVRLSRPRAATDIARFLAGLSGFPGPADPADGEQSARDLLPTLIAD
jgi:hypothetical protein